MKEYLLIFRGGLDFKTATSEQIEASMLKWKNWMDDLDKKGRDGNGRRLLPLGAVISGDKKKVTDGPYVEGKEIVGGYKVIKAFSLAEAIEIGKTCPILDYGGITEVREMAEPIK